MVSTDGSEITPDEPNGHGDSNPADENAEENAARDETQTATEEHEAEETNGSVNGHSRRKRRRRKRTDEQPGKQRIDRLVMEFQPDVVEMEHRKVAGGLRWTLYVVILLLAGTIAWATWAKVDRFVVAEGKLVTTENPIVLQSAITANIRKIGVRFNQVVEAGEPLVWLDPTIPAADVAKAEAILNGLSARLARLRAEQNQMPMDISGHELEPIWQTEAKLFVERKTEYEAKIDEFAAEKQKLDARKAKNVGEVEDLTDRVRIRQDMYKTTVGLSESRSATKTEVLNDEMELNFARKELNTAQNQLIETETEFRALEKRKSSYTYGRQAEVSVELAEVHQQHLATTEDLNKARRTEEMSVLKVPDDLGHKRFKVVEIAKLSGGSVAQPGDALVRLVPADDLESLLEAEVKVEGKDVARIKEGQKVRVKLTSYPYMKYGWLNGVIREINDDATEEGQAPMTSTFYKVRVKIVNKELRNVPHDNELIVGMGTTAEIVIGRRRVIDYFIYPLFRKLDSTIREP